MDLSRWVKQGVFLANAYLTVRRYNPGKHTFWDTFTKYWIKALSNHKGDLTWLLMGNFAQSYVTSIRNTNYNIMTSHPSPLGYMKTTKNAPAFKGSKCFELINASLFMYEHDVIKW